jgi:hypothetical protein
MLDSIFQSGTDERLCDCRTDAGGAWGVQRDRLHGRAAERTREQAIPTF